MLKGTRTMKRIVLVALCLLTATATNAADVQMGGVTLKLITPKGYCELEPGQASDKRMIDFLNTALSKGPNELLGISADCGELRDWRAGKLKLLQHFSQYQVEKVRRSSAFTINEAKGACNEMREQGQKLSDAGTKDVNEGIHAANSKIDFQGQTFLGVLADDPNGCYVGLYQKYKAETGAQISQINVFYAGSIKEREVFFYAWTPYENDSTVKGMLGTMQSWTAALKAANGL
jgi:hypothetical protein